MSYRSATSRVLTLVALTTLLLALEPRSASAGLTAKNPTAVATVRFIWHGLAIQRPHHRYVKSTIKQPLYADYGLRTLVRQKASLSFRDSTLLHINERTDAVLKSATVTDVKQGEVQAEVAPGSTHRIRTNAAVVTAIGTRYDVKVRKTTSTITVIEGAVLVHTSRGDVTVRTNEVLTLKKGQAPGQPQPVQTAPVQQWTAIIPAPSVPLGLNVALHANGAAVTAVSSERDSSVFRAGNAIDGSLSQGWQTAQGRTAHEFITVRLGAGKVYTLRALILDCAATGGQGAENDLKDFTLETSTDGSSFSPVLHGTCQQRSGLQLFGVQAEASEIRLNATTNWGGSAGIALAELEAISADTPPVLGTPTPLSVVAPTPTNTATPGATATATPVQADVVISATSVYAANDFAPSDVNCSAPGEHPAPITTTDPVMVVKQAIGRWIGTHAKHTDWYAPDGTLASSGTDHSYTDLQPGQIVCGELSLGGFKRYKIPGTWTVKTVVDGHVVSTTTFTMLLGSDKIVYSGLTSFRDPPGSTISPGTCAYNGEQASTAVKSTDTYVMMKFGFSVWQGTHTVHVEWHYPDGTIAFQDGFTQTDAGFNSTTFFPWCEWMNVAGSPAATMPGPYTFQLFVDGQLVDTTTFTIMTAAFATRAHSQSSTVMYADPGQRLPGRQTNSNWANDGTRQHHTGLGGTEARLHGIAGEAASFSPSSSPSPAIRWAAARRL